MEHGSDLTDPHPMLGPPGSTCEGAASAQVECFPAAQTVFLWMVWQVGRTALMTGSDDLVGLQLREFRVAQFQFVPIDRLIVTADLVGAQPGNLARRL